MNSNELNEKVLDACLDSACFQILHAYIQLGGWNPDQEVFLPQTYWKRWGISRRSLTRHRPHLVESGWLTPTDKMSREGNCKYRVTVPKPICHTPRANLAYPLSQSGATPTPDCPTEVINSNIQNNEKNNERGRASAPGTENISVGEVSNKEETSSDFTEEAAGAVAGAPNPSSSSGASPNEDNERLPRTIPPTEEAPAGRAPVSADPARPTELETQLMMAWLKRYSPEVYGRMRPKELRQAAQSRLSWPLRAEQIQRDRERRAAYSEAVAEAKAAQKATAVDW